MYHVRNIFCLSQGFPRIQDFHSFNIDPLPGLKLYYTYLAIISHSRLSGQVTGGIQYSGAFMYNIFLVLRLLTRLLSSLHILAYVFAITA